MFMKGLAYYLRRLTTMSFNEPFARLRSSVIHRQEKLTYRNHPEAYSLERLFEERATWLAGGDPQGIGSLADEGIRSALPERWWQDAGFWSLFAELYPRESAELLNKADRLLGGRLTLFQWREIDLNELDCWSMRFSGLWPQEEWPRDHYSDIRFLQDAADPERDVKWCWELNRFQHLLWLGAAWRLSREEKYARLAKRHLESWMTTVVYPLGVQWSSNLEVGLRLLSWARCHVLCMEAGPWDQEFMNRFITCIYLHAWHLNKELTTHHALSNHILGEASALLIVGILYPVLADSGTWRSRSLSILERIVPRLIPASGVYAEQSTGYFRFVLEFLLPVIHLAGANGIELPEAAVERVNAGLRFLATLTPDLRQVPMIGDADSGLAIGWQLSDFWDFSSVVASGSVLCNEPHLLEDQDHFPAEAFLMLGPWGLEKSKESVSAKLPEGTRGSEGGEIRKVRAPHRGYQTTSDSRFQLTLDTAPLGLSPAFGHGHADGLSFVLWHNGKPAIVDPGTFTYNGLPEWREYFRSTAAHNTLAIDGGSQSIALGTFRWAKRLKIAAGIPDAGISGWWLLKGRITWHGVVHRRYVLHMLEQGLVVLDLVDGAGSHTVRWSTHWGPQWQLIQRKGFRLEARCKTGSLRLLLVPPEGATTSMLRGSEDPRAGWYSSKYGFKEPCVTLTATVDRDLPVCFLFAVKEAGSRLEAPTEVLDFLLPPELMGLCRTKDFVDFCQPRK